MFSNVVLPPSDKPVLKIPSKMKDSLREAKAAMERRLKDEQKVVSSSFSIFMNRQGDVLHSGTYNCGSCNGMHLTIR